MRTTKFILLAIAAAAITTSCSNDPANDKLTFILLEHTSAYTLANSASGYTADTDLTIAENASLLFPDKIFGKTPTTLQDSIFAAAFGTCEGKHHQIINDYLDRKAADLGFSTEKIDAHPYLGDSVYKADGFLSITGTVEAMSTKTLAYAISESSYAPRAAHGMTTTKYINYDIPNDRIITLKEIFSAKGLDALPAILRQRASELETVIGPTDVSALPANGNFYITTNGDIVFAYQPYEVASYSQGAIELRFEPYHLYDQLSPEGKRLFNLAGLSD